MKLKRLLTLCCALSMALGMVPFATLQLVQGEYVTDVRFEFGTVPSGFSSVVKPTMRVQVLGTVSNGYQIINRADVGGQYLNEWQTAKTTWVTTVRRFNTTPLPKTGY